MRSDLIKLLWVIDSRDSTGAYHSFEITEQKKQGVETIRLSVLLQGNLIVANISA